MIKLTSYNWPYYFPTYVTDKQDKPPAKGPLTTTKKGKNTSLSLPKTSKGLSALAEDGTLILVFLSMVYYPIVTCRVG